MSLIFLPMIAPNHIVYRVAWDPATKYESSGTLSLSNANLTWTQTSGTGYITATTSRSSGKWYFECLINSTTSADQKPTVGITQNNPWGGGINEAGTWMIQAGNGSLPQQYDYGNGNFQANGTSYAPTDVMQFAIDLNAGKIWYGKNNTWLHSGNPAAGTGAAWSDVGIATTTKIVSVSAASDGLTARFAMADFGYAPPSGFLPWQS